MPSHDSSCAFYHKTCARLLLHFSYCAFCGLATCAALSSLTLLNFCCCAFCGIATHTTLSTPFLFTFFHSRHFLHLCSSSPYLKHLTLFASCLLIVLSSNPHYITLLLNTSNLFLGMTFPFSFPPLFLQFWARYPNSLHLLHSFPLLPLSSSPSLVRVRFSLSRLLINEWYCS